MRVIENSGTNLEPRVLLINLTLPQILWTSISSHIKNKTRPSRIWMDLRSAT